MRSRVAFGQVHWRVLLLAAGAVAFGALSGCERKERVPEPGADAESVSAEASAETSTETAGGASGTERETAGGEVTETDATAGRGRCVNDEDPETSIAKREKPVTMGEEAQLRASVREYAEAKARQGFTSAADTERFAVDYFAEDWPARRVGPVARLETPLAYERHAADEKTWLELTDCDRLDAAFADLEQCGILARQNYTDCGRCGADEIYALMEKRAREGQNVRGYAFFHEQDTEAAARGETLYVSYGSIKDHSRYTKAIGREVAAALNRHGLTATWDGDVGNRVAVENIDWKKRRTTTAPRAGTN